MTTLNSRLQLALLNRKKDRNLLEKGFTLVELLVVVIIIGILSSVALPAFMNQAAKAKIGAAKSLVASGAKECQAFLVEAATGATFTLTTEGSDGIAFPGNGTGTADEAPADGDCTLALGGIFNAAITGGPTFTTTVSTMGGIDKTCTTTTAGTTAGDVIEGCTISENAGTTGTW